MCKQPTTPRPPLPDGPLPWSQPTAHDKRLIAQNMATLRASKKPAAMLDTIGKRLKAGRQLAGYSQIAAANTIGRTKGTLGGYEADRLTPLEEDLRCLAELYYLPLDWLKFGDQLQGDRGAQAGAWAPDVPTILQNAPAGEFGARRGGTGA